MVWNSFALLFAWRTSLIARQTARPQIHLRGSKPVARDISPSSYHRPPASHRSMLIASSQASMTMHFLLQRMAHARCFHPRPLTSRHDIPKHLLQRRHRPSPSMQKAGIHPRNTVRAAACRSRPCWDPTTTSRPENQRSRTHNLLRHRSVTPIHQHP
jgi:hypothetical protein